jgi:hypothetical protein
MHFRAYILQYIKTEPTCAQYYCLFIYLFIYLFTYLFIYLSIYLFCSSSPRHVSASNYACIGVYMCVFVCVQKKRFL